MGKELSSRQVIARATHLAGQTVIDLPLRPQVPIDSSRMKILYIFLIFVNSDFVLDYIQ